jgi:hypothetical protein
MRFLLITFNKGESKWRQRKQLNLQQKRPLQKKQLENHVALRRNNYLLNSIETAGLRVKPAVFLGP